MSRLVITNITTRILELPVKAVHSHGSGDISGIKTVVVEINTNGGITGFGLAQ